MLIKVEEYGLYSNLFFRCPCCQRYVSINQVFPKDPWLRQKLLTMMNDAMVCDDCAKTPSAGESGVAGEKPAGRMEA